MALGAAGAARADVASLFDGLARDFGAVPHGETLTHNFWLTNTTGDTLRVGAIRVSCGCTTAAARQPELAPGQSTAVVAQMDTRRFLGVRSVTIFVDFEQPLGEEVRLTVQANSRDDLICQPETIAFEKVKRGATPSVSTQVTFVGSGEEQIVSASSASSYIEVSFKEVSREAGQVRYQVTARLRPDLPAGNWYSDVWLSTNSPSAPKVLIPVLVEIAAR